MTNFNRGAVSFKDTVGTLEGNCVLPDSAKHERRLALYLKRAIRLLGPDGVATIVAREFRHAGYPKHLRRVL
jgi:hypothetical protein